MSSAMLAWHALRTILLAVGVVQLAGAVIPGRKRRLNLRQLVTRLRAIISGHAVKQAHWGVLIESRGVG